MEKQIGAGSQRELEDLAEKWEMQKVVAYTLYAAFKMQKQLKHEMETQIGVGSPSEFKDLGRKWEMKKRIEVVA